MKIKEPLEFKTANNQAHHLINVNSQLTCLNNLQGGSVLTYTEVKHTKCKHNLINGNTNVLVEDFHLLMKVKVNKLRIIK